MRTHLKVPHLTAIVLLTASTLWAQGTSSWVFFGRMVGCNMPRDAQGNRAMDYSYAGYQGGGVIIPTVPVQQTVSPSGGDDTAAIQAAIKAVSNLSPDDNGFRGAVLLQPGTFNLSRCSILLRALLCCAAAARAGVRIPMCATGCGVR